MNIKASLTKFKKRHINMDNSDFSEAKTKGRSSATQDPMKMGVVGGAVGTVAGAGIGALIGRNNAIESYESSTAPSQVELSWQQPVFQREVLGQIPRDVRLGSSFPGAPPIHQGPSSWLNPHTEDVVRKNPALDVDGNPVIKDHLEVFKGIGEPRVSWTTNRIVTQQLTGFNQRTKTQYEGQLFCTDNLFPPSDAKLEQVCVDYDPVINTQDHGTYQAPKVRFERPGDAAQKINSATLSGAAKGAGIGLVSGVVMGVAGSVLGRLLEDK